MSRILSFPVILLLKLVAWVYYLQPGPIRLFLGRALGALLRVFEFRAKVIRQNLEFAYPSSPATREALFKQAYAHLATLILEILLLFGPLKRFVGKRVKLVGAENWRQAKAQGKGVIFLSSHVGNWEVMGATGGLMAEKELLFVTKHLKPEWLHQAVSRARLKCDVRATYEPKTLKDVLRELAAGRTVGFVLDQYMGPPIGVRVPVFGIPVGTSSAIATLAKRTGAVVLPVVNYRTSEGRFVVDIRPGLEWKPHENPEYELALNTAYYSEVLERDIREHADQWLWTHRRFKGDLSPLRPGEWMEGRSRR